MPGNFLQKSRHSTVYYFRRRVPGDLRERLGLTQIYRSLETCSRREAIIRARALAAQTDTIFAQARKMNEDNLLTVGYTFEIDLSEWGRPKKIKVETNGEEEDHAAAQKAIETLVPALLAQAPVDTQPTMADSLAPPTAPLCGPTLQEAMDEYLARDDIKPTSKKSYRTKIKYLIDLKGASSKLLAIDQAQMTELAKKIAADERWSVNSRRYYINDICSFLNWHRLNLLGPRHELSVENVRPKRETPDSENRDAFTLEQIGVLFQNAEQYRTCEPHKFWVTVAVAFFGSRLEEICHINLHNDLVHDDDAGVWYLNLREGVDPDGAKRQSMKRPTSWRRVPVHSALVRHGFIDYLQEQRKSGYARPFEQGWPPHIDGKGDGNDDGLLKWSHAITKWGGRELNVLAKAGKIVKDKRTYFGSMRPTLTTLLDKAGVVEGHRAALQGHSMGSGQNSRTYSKLKQDHVFLSGLIEKHLDSYVELLEKAL